MQPIFTLRLRAYIAALMLSLFQAHAETVRPATAPEITQPSTQSDAIFAEHPVTLKTPTGILYGSELMPATKVPVRVVLLHAGSGPTDRNGNSRLLPGSNNSLKLLAEALARNGIASLRFDKRGIGMSAPAGPAEADLRFEMYVDDAAAWVAQLRTDARFSKIIIAGHSEGSLIGMLAAHQSGADAYVSIAGIARSADDVVRDQLRSKLPAALFEQADRSLKALKEGKNIADPPAALASLFRPSVQPYMISWIKYTPTEVIKTLKLPVLIVQGTTDIQVATAEAKGLAAAKPDATLALIDGMNHVLKMVSNDAAAQRNAYSDPTLPVSEQLINTIAGFVKGLK